MFLSYANEAVDFTCNSTGGYTAAAFLTARPWAERGSWFTRGFLTARPWAERGSWFTLVFFFSTSVRADPSFHSAKF